MGEYILLSSNPLAFIEGISDYFFNNMHMVKFLFAKEKVLGQFLNPLMSKWKHKGIRVELLTADHF